MPASVLSADSMVFQYDIPDPAHPTRILCQMTAITPKEYAVVYRLAKADAAKRLQQELDTRGEPSREHVNTLIEELQDHAPGSDMFMDTRLAVLNAMHWRRQYERLGRAVAGDDRWRCRLFLSHPRAMSLAHTLRKGDQGRGKHEAHIVSVVTRHDC